MRRSSLNNVRTRIPAATHRKYTSSDSAPSTQCELRAINGPHGIITSIMAPKSAMSTVGILALQGDFDAHRKMLAQLPETVACLVRTPDDLATVDALVLPGGESTTIAKLMNRNGLMEPLRQRLAAGMPAFGTCAGLILLATSIYNRPDQPTIGVLNVEVDRNAFGRQVDSFESDIPFPLPNFQNCTVRGVFIRAPYVRSIGNGVEILARFENRIVAVRQGNILATAFHPELTDDTRVHNYFGSIVASVAHAARNAGGEEPL